MWEQPSVGFTIAKAEGPGLERESEHKRAVMQFSLTLDVT